jgi:hypothetical protein
MTETKMVPRILAIGTAVHCDGIRLLQQYGFIMIIISISARIQGAVSAKKGNLRRITEKL